ncbi:hypothetical protein ACFFRR_001710 [Megaselia abdita]
MQFNNRFLLKILELAFTVTCIILIAKINEDIIFSNEAIVICGTFSGFTIICSVFLIGHIIEAQVDKRIGILFSLSGCVFSIVSGSILIHNWDNITYFTNDKELGIGAGAMSIINGFIFLADTFGFCLVCIIIWEITANPEFSSQPLIVCGTLIGYTIICTVIIVGHILSADLDKKVNGLFSIVAMVLFIVSGALMISQWQNAPTLFGNNDRDYALALGALMAIAIVCIILWESTSTVFLSKWPLIVCGTIVGFTIICGVIVIGNIINSDIDKKLAGIIAIVGCVMFVTAGALIIDEWHDASFLSGKENKNKALAAGSLMIINSAVFLLDTIFICRS